MTRGILHLLVILLASACTTSPTGRSQLLLYSEESAIVASRQAYTEMLAPLEKEGKIDTNPLLKDRVLNITSRLVAQAVQVRPETNNWSWEIKVIDDSETINAWAMAGGKMAIYTGLVEKIDLNDDELAQVIGHEIAHALVKHSTEKMSVATATHLGIAAVGFMTDNQVTMTGAALLAALAVTLPNSRTMESEADLIGIEIASKAGYNPNAVISLWQKMSAEGNRNPPQFLSTHPNPAARLETLRTLIPEMMPYYTARRERPAYFLN